MKLKFEVTAEDIQQGTQGSTRGCPVYRAIHRTLPGRVRVWVEEIDVQLPNQKKAKSIKCSPRLKRFVRNFDADRYSVKPLTFSLELGEILK